MEDAVPVIAERIAEAEEAYEKAVSAKASREEKHTEAVKSAEEAKAAAEAADERASDAMAVVEQMMEEVLAARVAWSEAEEEIRALDERREKLTSEAQKAAEKAAKKAAAGAPRRTRSASTRSSRRRLSRRSRAAPAAAAAAAEAAKEKAEAEEKERAEAEEKEKEKAESEAVAASVPKPQGSSKQIASKFFTSSEDKAQGTSLAAGIALAFAFFAGMLLPSAQPVRHAVASSVAQVTATIDSGYKSIVANIPESERKLAEHALEEAHEAGLLDALVLLFTSISRGDARVQNSRRSPVLGFLVGGAVVGPYMLGIVDHVAQAKVLAEFGVVFLLFNIGLELSYERLQSMARFIFGMGSMQMLLTTVGIAARGDRVRLDDPPGGGRRHGPGVLLHRRRVAGAAGSRRDGGETRPRHLLRPALPGSHRRPGVHARPAPRRTGLGIHHRHLRFARQGHLQDRGRHRRHHGRRPRGAPPHLQAHREAPQFRGVDRDDALHRARDVPPDAVPRPCPWRSAPSSPGLLLAETEFHLQVESDIAPFRGLLLGLFFMTVGMQIDPGTLFATSGRSSASPSGCWR